MMVISYIIDVTKLPIQMIIIMQILRNVNQLKNIWYWCLYKYLDGWIRWFPSELSAAVAKRGVRSFSVRILPFRPGPSDLNAGDGEDDDWWEGRASMCRRERGGGQYGSLWLSRLPSHISTQHLLFKYQLQILIHSPIQQNYFGIFGRPKKN